MHENWWMRRGKLCWFFFSFSAFIVYKLQKNAIFFACAFLINWHYRCFHPKKYIFFIKTHFLQKTGNPLHYLCSPDSYLNRVNGINGTITDKGLQFLTNPFTPVSFLKDNALLSLCSVFPRANCIRNTRRSIS